MVCFITDEQCMDVEICQALSFDFFSYYCIAYELTMKLYYLVQLRTKYKPKFHNKNATILYKHFKLSFMYLSTGSYPCTQFIDALAVSYQFAWKSS